MGNPHGWICSRLSPAGSWCIALLSMVIVSLAFGATNNLAVAIGPAAASLSVSHTGHRVKVSMSVPKSWYPLGALVPVTVIIQNLSDQPVTAVNNCTEDSFVTVQVIGPRSHVLYPANNQQIPGEPPLACIGGAGGLTLQPGSVYKKRLLVVLYSGTLEATARMDLMQSPSSPTLRESFVSTPRIKVSLTSSGKPRVSLRRNAPVSARLTPKFPTVKHLRFLMWYECAPGNQVNESHGNWDEVTGRVLEAPCPQPTAWHVIAGWPGQSVTHIDYSAP